MSWLDYAAIREQISILRVLELLDWKPTRRRGHQWRGVCPLCCSSDPRGKPQHPFSVHVTRNLFRCFRCQRSGNQLDLWAAATGLPLHPATINLRNHLDNPPTQLKNPQPRNAP
ncbi:MAG: CHC2 zinc finger domain-containing protein [Pirellulaceae bacterium]